MLLLKASDTHDFRPLPFYLAMEQWAAAALPDKEVFFSWVVRPTVIIGRNQQLDAEVNVDYCRAHGIDIVRRRSGGGCVYADPDNLMISYVCRTSESVPRVFAGFAERLAAILNELGVNASVSGRNDILIDGRKVSGGAYYHTGSHAIVHSTLLFGSDPMTMMQAITPDRSKLASKGVQSVAAEITTISQHQPGVTIERFREHCRALTDSQLTLTPTQEAQVREIEATYRAPGWLEGRKRKSSVTKKSRIEGVGIVEADLSLAGDMITDAAFCGDFLLGSAPVDTVRRKLIGQRLNGIRLDDINVSDSIVGLSNSQLINILTQ